MHPPANGVTVTWGIAVSKRNRRYEFLASSLECLPFAYREDPRCLSDGRTYWLSVRAPRALIEAVEHRLRQ